MDRTASWSMLVDPLQHVGALELLQRAGLPPSLGAAFDSPSGRRALAAHLWRPAARWQEADALAPRSFVTWLEAPSSVMVRRLPLLGAFCQAAFIRRLVRGQEQRAIREVIGQAAYDEVFSVEPALSSLSAENRSDQSFSLDPSNGSTLEILEREGMVSLASMALSFGLAWLEVLRLQTPQRLLPSIESASPWQNAAAHAFADAALPHVAAMVPADS
jgi:hypothetical protein